MKRRHARSPRGSGRPAAVDAVARLAAVIDSSDDAIVSKTLDGVITSWNRAAERIFGYTAAEAVGQHITLIIPPERHAEEHDVLARIRRGEAVDRFDTVRVAKDGRRLDISLTVSPIKNAAGAIVGASKIARDVTEWRRAELERAWLAAIVDSSDDAIVSKTLEGMITSWNRAAERMFGYTAAEAVGRHITLIIPPERHAEEDHVLARLRLGQAIEHFDTERIRKDGTLIAVSITVSPVRDATGAIVGASKVARDITDRKRAESERASLLEREQAARRQSEELHRTKDEFLATLSHELRTPVNAIFGWARMLQMGQLDGVQARRAVDAITRNALAQVHLVEDLLDMSRIITGNMRLEVRPVDLRAVIEAALDAVRPAANAKAIDLVAVLDAAAGPVLGAAERLQQVVWNLLINAVKFTPRGGRVEIVLQRADANVEIVVRDTGRGIDAALLPHVFERFRQGDSTSTRAHGGLGLGLALVRHLVDLHGGTVSAESAGEGKGATFIVRLPGTIARRAAHGDSASIAAGAGGGDRRLLDGVRVLIVDDDLDSLEIVGVMLATRGAQTRTTTSASGALDILEAWRPDVLVADIEMPGEDGYALLRRVRALDAERGGRTPAAALTAYGRVEDRRRALASGFNLHLAKPVDPDELAVAVASLAGRAWPAPGQPPSPSPPLIG